MKAFSRVFLAASLVLCAMASSPAEACMCASDKPFLSVRGNADLVVRATVLSYGPRLEHGEDLFASMVLSVSDVLGGEEPAASVRVHGDPGNLCRPYVTPERFGLGTEYVLALDRLRADEDDNLPQYAISLCGTHWLEIIDGKVTGQIRRKKSESMSYEAFLERLQKKGAR